MRDPLTWFVIYTDERRFNEYDDDGKDHGWAEVDAARVGIIGLEDIAGQCIHAVLVPSGQTAVFFRRRTITISTGSGDEVARSSATCMGWDGAYLWLYADGSVVLSNTRE